MTNNQYYINPLEKRELPKPIGKKKEKPPRLYTNLFELTNKQIHAKGRCFADNKAYFSKWAFLKFNNFLKNIIFQKKGKKKQRIYFWNLIPKILGSIVKMEGRVRNKELPGKRDKNRD